jgi:hypothetical protein
MTPRDGYRDDEQDEARMDRELNDHLAEEVLSGHVDEPDLASMARALDAYRVTAASAGMSRDLRATIIAAAADAARDAGAEAAAPVAVSVGRRLQWLPQFATRFAAAAVVFVVLTTGAAAAGLLPEPVRGALETFYRVVGVDLPDAPSTEASPPTTSTTSTTSSVPVGPSTTTGVDTTSGGVTRPGPPSIGVSLRPAVEAIPETRGFVEFLVTVENLSMQRVTVSDLEHSLFGDLLAPPSGAVMQTACNVESVVIEGGSRFECSFEAKIVGRAGEPDHVGTIEVTAIDGWSRAAHAGGEARVAFTDVLPSVATQVSSATEVLYEPAGSAQLTLTIENTSVERVDLVSVSDPVLGDLLDPDNPNVADNTCLDLSERLGRGEIATCDVVASFAADAAIGTIGPSIQVVVRDRQGNLAAETSDLAFSVQDVLPSLAVSVRASALAVSPTLPAVTFTVDLSNESSEAIELLGLSDAVFGSLFSIAPSVGESNCSSLGRYISAGATATCRFTISIDEGATSGLFYSTVSATATDNEGNIVEATDQVAVGITADVARLNGVAFEDHDRDGVWDAEEPGLQGVGVRVTAPGIGSIVLTTDSGGSWSVLVPSGPVTHTVLATTVPMGMVGSVGADVERTTDVQPGSSAMSDPRGYWYPPETIEGSIEFDTSEAVGDTVAIGIPGVVVTLVDDAGTIIDTTTTDRDGRFSFRGSGAGSFAVVVEPSSVPGGLELMAESDGSVDGSIGVVVAAYGRVSGVDVRYRGVGAFAVTADPDAVGTAYVTWWGFDGIAATGDEIVWSTRTVVDGRYRFTGIPHGPYGDLIVVPD